jgi:DNA-binding NarL/FixJ family response regulator
MNLVLIEDDLSIQLAFSQYLKAQSEFENISVFSSAESFESATLSYIPDVFLLDIKSPKKSGAEFIPIINSKYPTVGIILLTDINDNENESVSPLIKEDAVSYLGKESSLAKIKNIMLELNALGAPVTKMIARKDFDCFNSKNTFAELLNSREKQIAAGLASGLSYKLIAFEYNISIDTVRKYIKSLYRKLKIHSKGELSFKYFQDKNF